MRVYLDDIRRAPVGWTRVKTAAQCIERLRSGKVEELSLDHDLAPEHYEAMTGYVPAGPSEVPTGLAVVDWMVEHKVWPSVIILHTMNPAGRANMQRTIERHAPEHVRVEVRIGWRG